MTSGALIREARGRHGLRGARRQTRRQFSAGEIFAELERHRVNYVAIGGIAANAHGSRRLTLDVDIVPEPETPNYERLAAALDDLDSSAGDQRA
jgi:hypothetical protein